MAEQNAYAILNLRKGADEQAVKQAYVELVKRYDPEKHTERFMVIQNAYERLRDPVKRAREDVFTYNYVRGEFGFTPDERAEEDAAEANARIAQAEEQWRKDVQSPQIRGTLVIEYMKRSFRHTQKKLWTEAIKDWAGVLQIDPTHQRAKSNLLFAYVYLGYYYALHDLLDEAVQLWEKSLQMDPDNTAVIHNLALASERSGALDRAHRYWAETVRRWKLLLDQQPDDDYLRNCIIEVHKHHGGKALQSHPTAETKQEAVDQYREILKINPEDFDAQYNIANALLEDGKFDEAIEQLKGLNTQHPRNIEIVNLLGWAYLNAGKFEMAFGTWRRGLVQDPEEPHAEDIHHHGSHERGQEAQGGRALHAGPGAFQGTAEADAQPVGTAL